LDIDINLAILKVLRSDYRGVAADIQQLLYVSNSASEESFVEGLENTVESEYKIKLPSVETLRFAADYYFDFGDLLRSAEIYSYINDEKANLRQADALFLAGLNENAISIWTILAGTGNERSLYNLAVITQEKNEDASFFLEKLSNVSDFSDSNINSIQFGLIRYSRLLDLPRAGNILNNTTKLSPADFPFIDLEINKRFSAVWSLNRQIAETWLLLDRHGDNEDLNRWAAWHFFFQRRFDEIPIFLDRLASKNSTWLDFYRALKMMNDGNLQTAENTLLSIPEANAEWYVNANLGRIYEELRSPSRALIQYELAASKLQVDLHQNRKTASRIQQRIARCFTALGRPSEATRVLLYALDLDPDNLSARLELGM